MDNQNKIVSLKKKKKAKQRKKKQKKNNKKKQKKKKQQQKNVFPSDVDERTVVQKGFHFLISVLLCYRKTYLQRQIKQKYRIISKNEKTIEI